MIERTMHLLFDHFDQLTQAPENLKSLRQWIIDLGVRGQLTQAWREEHPGTEFASVLLEKIKVERVRLVKEKKIKKTKPSLPIATDEIPYNLPEGWVWCRIGAFTEVVRGKSPKYSEVGDRKILNQKCVRWFKVEVHHAKTVLEEWFDEIDQSNLTQEGDVLVNSTGEGTIGRSALVRGDSSGFLFDSHVLRIRQILGINPYFVSLFINAVSGQTQIESLKGAKSTKQTELGVNNLSSIVFPFPPLAEQQAIVEKVESLLAKVSQLQVRAGEMEASKMQVGQSVCGWLADAPLGGETARRFQAIAPQFGDIFSTLPNLKALRQTILQLAIQGKLTESWRATHPAVEPASALLERIQAEKARLVKEKKIKKPKPLPPIAADEVPFDLPEGWVWCRLERVTSKIGSGSTPKGGKEVYVDQGIPFFRSQNIYEGGLVLDDVAYISLEVHTKMIGTQVLASDVLLNITGGSIGRSTLVPKDFGDGNVSQHVCIIRPIAFSSPYLHKLVLSPYVQNEIYGSTTGAGREGLPKYNLEKFAIPLPPLAEQQAIVEKVESLLAKVSQLEQGVEQNRQYAEQLLQSVLREVMQGTHPAKETTA